MKHRIYLVFVVILLVILIPFSKWLRFPAENGLCNNNFLCESYWLDGVALPLSNSLIYLIFSVAILIPFSFSVLKTWLKIMIPYFIVSLYFVAVTPDVCGGMLCWDRTLVASGLSKVFLILTILIVLTKSIYLFVVSKRAK